MSRGKLIFFFFYYWWLFYERGSNRPADYTRSDHQGRTVRRKRRFRLQGAHLCYSPVWWPVCTISCVRQQPVDCHGGVGVGARVGCTDGRTTRTSRPTSVDRCPSSTWARSTWRPAWSDGRADPRTSTPARCTRGSVASWTALGCSLEGGARERN